MSTDPLDWIDAALRDFDVRQLRRRVAVRGGPQGARAVVGGREVLNFGSNDYLGLAADPRLVEAAVAALRRFGCGSGASPLVTGHSELHEALARRVAEFEGVEAALTFPSGFAANSGTVAALAGPGDVVLTDRKNHASLLDGCRLSRADVRPYPHCDWRALDDLLARHGGRYRRRLIVTDSLFSIDGDLAPLAELAEVASRHDAMLLIDEAHATGVFGPAGRGVAEALGVEDRIDVRVGTLSKALGAAGGFVAGSQRLVDWLVNSARPYIFSTAGLAASAAAAIAALEIVAKEPHRGSELLERAARLRATLQGRGWNTGTSASQIIPILVGEAGRALELAARLRERGIWVPAIRPPTVPEGEACLRVSLSWAHDEEMVGRLCEELGAPNSFGG